MSSTSSSSSNNTQWAHRLFQDPAMLSPLPPVKPPATASGPASEQQQQCSAFQGCDGVTSATPKSGKKLSVSRLAFPFNARRKVAPPPTPSPTGPPSPPSPIPTTKRAGPYSEPPLRQKHVCLPSPLGRGASDDAPSEMTPTPVTPATAARIGPRPRYHGYSRHSFMLTKWVWSTRQEQHEVRTSASAAEATSSSPISPSSTSPAPSSAFLLPNAPSTSHPSFHRIRRLRSFYIEEKKPEQAPLTMYPRQGDVAALRDPYCARVDRCFASVPLYTLRKMACLFTLHLPRQEPFEEAGSEVSFGSGSDAATLVDSDSEAESEWDVSTTCSSRHDGEDGVDSASSELSKGNLLSLAVRRVQNNNRDLGNVRTAHMAETAWLCEFYRKPDFGSLPKEQQQRVWPAGGWAGVQWELLIELSKRDAPVPSRDSPVASLPPSRKEVVKPKPPKEFRWLKLLGGPKTGAGAGAKKVPGALPLASPGMLSPPLPLSSSPSPASTHCPGKGGVRATFLCPSHPAAG